MCGPDWQLILEYLKVLLSWPPLAAIALICFVRQFDEQIGVFLTNVRPKGPGFDPVLPTQPFQAPPKPDEEPELPDDHPPPEDNAPDDADAALGGGAKRAAPNAPIGDAAAELARWEAEVRYLNGAFVLLTQLTLDEVLRRGSLPIDEYAMMWPETSPANRSNMLTALYQHGLVEVDQGIIRPTEKGRRYGRWHDRTEWVKAQLAVVAPDNKSSTNVENPFVRGIGSTPFAAAVRRHSEKHRNPFAQSNAETEK